MAKTRIGESIKCGKLASGIMGFDCENPLIAGVRPNVVLFNIDDINHETTTKDEKGTITSLELKDGAIAYLASLNENAVDPTVTFNKGTYVNSWTHSLVLRIINNGIDVKEFIQNLEKSRIVAIVENNYGSKTGEVKYEAYGFDAGLVMTECTHDVKDAETLGGYVFTVASDENAREPLLQRSVFIGDSLEATRLALESIITPPTPAP